MSRPESGSSSKRSRSTWSCRLAREPSNRSLPLEGSDWPLGLEGKKCGPFAMPDKASGRLTMRNLDCYSMWGLGVSAAAAIVLDVPPPVPPVRHKPHLIKRLSPSEQEAVLAARLGDVVEVGGWAQCNKCGCRIERVSSTEFLNLGCMCTLLLCVSDPEIERKLRASRRGPELSSVLMYDNEMPYR